MQDAEPFSLDAAWDHLRDLACMLVTLFGAPAALAARLILVRASRQKILSWLAPLEALARRLLFIEASRLPKANYAAPPAPRGRVANAFRDAPETPLSENAEEWRVVFHVMPGGTRGRVGQPTQTQPAAPVKFNAVALAKRIEALLRLAEDRAGALKRLARRLSATNAKPARAFAPFRYPAGPVETFLAAAQAEASACFADSS